MRFFVGVTDFDWYRFLASRPHIDEVNFWQPSGGVRFGALLPGELFLFKLHSPRNFIVGGAFFAHWSPLPVSLAWEAFGEKNGTASLVEMRDRLAHYRGVPDDPRTDYVVGCLLLEQPFFLAEADWIPAPADWARSIVRGKRYDAATGEGRLLWDRLQAAPAAVTASVIPAASPFEPQPVQERYGQPTLVYPRLGQGSFRVLVTDIYDRRCAVTGERTLPVLDAAHIKPFGANGPHDPRNGLLLRSDLHTLLDRGYVTVTPDLRFQVSGRIREEFENGRDYYRLDGQRVRPPAHPDLAPAADYLDWHASNVYQG
jgi:putative restriction endonuclease